ncbi:MAG: polyamine aminopropyltransferase [Cyanobacteria bacterium P01_H01_bin.74]
MALWVHENFQNSLSMGYKVTDMLFNAQSKFQQISIVETALMGKMLLLDGMVMTSERDEFIYHELIAHIPLLAHPCPKTVLIIGGGDGGTLREVLKHPTVERAVLCEIDEMVIDACKQFLPTIASTLNSEQDAARFEIELRDGAAYVYENPNTFDVIIVDSTDPIGPGERLFTEAFYKNTKAALTESGIMVNQSESPISSPDECRRINAMLHAVFPVVKPYTACVPTYPGSQWTWTFCSNGILPNNNTGPSASQPDRVAPLTPQCRYFNADIQHAVFALPNYMEALLSPSVDRPLQSCSRN